MRLISWIIMVPVAVVVIGFSMTNRAPVPVEVWPVAEPQHVPLFAVVLAGAGLGFVIGALVAWLAGAPARQRARAEGRRARAAEKELALVRDDVERLEAAAQAPPSADAA